jgi:hypothetical protein
MECGHAHAGPRVIGLDGVLAQQQNYTKSGFEFAYANVRQWVSLIAADLAKPWKMDGSGRRMATIVRCNCGDPEGRLGIPPTQSSPPNSVGLRWSTWRRSIPVPLPPEGT